MPLNTLRSGRHLIRAAILLGLLLSAEAAPAADSSRLYTSITGRSCCKS